MHPTLASAADAPSAALASPFFLVTASLIPTNDVYPLIPVMKSDLLPALPKVGYNPSAIGEAAGPSTRMMVQLGITSLQPSKLPSVARCDASELQGVRNASLFDLHHDRSGRGLAIVH